MSALVTITCDCSANCAEEIRVPATTPWDARRAAETEGWGSETPQSSTYDRAPGHVLEFEESSRG